MSKGIVFRNHQNEKIYPCAFYPIGSVYISFSSTNPSTYFGGTWQRIKGRFLLSADDSTYINEATGGEAKHTLTVNEMPSHGHDVWLYDTSPQLSPVQNSRSRCFDRDKGWNYGSSVVGQTGGNQAHNNMPPYVVVYMWRRTA